MGPSHDARATMDTIINYSLSALLNLLQDGTKTAPVVPWGPYGVTFKNEDIASELSRLGECILHAGENATRTLKITAGSLAAPETDYPECLGNIGTLI